MLGEVSALAAGARCPTANSRGMTSSPAYGSPLGDWRARAQCCGENATYFFPPNHFERKPEKDAREAVARTACRSCVVRPECLSYALRAGESHGIWGGLNELQRSRLRRRVIA